MSRHERYGTRDLCFSAWHRSLPYDDWSWIDIDHLAYCKQCSDPLYVIELALDVGQEYKATTVTRRLATGLGIPALLVFYTPAGESDIESLRVRRIAPQFGNWAKCEPQTLVEWIRRVRTEHVCSLALEEAA